MTAANFNASTGEIIGTFAYLSPQLAFVYVRSVYTNQTLLGGAYFVPLAAINALAAAQVGLSVSEFNNLSSSARQTLQNDVRNRYLISGGWSGSKISYSVYTGYVNSSTYRSVVNNAKKGSKGLTYAGANVQAELLVGFIPEWGNGTSTANINQKKLAVSKMGWSHDQTVEHAKAIRREKPQSIRTVFDNMIIQRDKGYSPANVIRRLI